VQSIAERGFKVVWVGTKATLVPLDSTSDRAAPPQANRPASMPTAAALRARELAAERPGARVYLPPGPRPSDQVTTIDENGVVHEQLLGQWVERRTFGVPVSDTSPGGLPNVKPSPGPTIPSATTSSGEGLFARRGPIGPRRQWHPRTLP
jgi:hypothetical protein